MLSTQSFYFEIKCIAFIFVQNGNCFVALIWIKNELVPITNTLDNSESNKKEKKSLFTNPLFEIISIPFLYLDI